MAKTVTPAPTKGIIIALILIVYSLVLQFTGQGQNKALSFISFVILFVGLLWSCMTYSKQNNQNVTYGNVFADGFKVTATVTVLICIFSLLLFNVISPDLKEQALKQMQENMEKSQASDEQIEKVMVFTKDHFNVLTVGAQMFFMVLAGVISSLIGAAAAKKNPQGPFVQQG